MSFRPNLAVFTRGMKKIPLSTWDRLHDQVPHSPAKPIPSSVKFFGTFISTNSRLFALKTTGKVLNHPQVFGEGKIFGNNSKF